MNTWLKHTNLFNTYVAIDKKIAGVSLYYRYANTMEESMVNGMGYQLMQMAQKVKTEAMFKMNATNYPKSSNV